MASSDDDEMAEFDNLNSAGEKKPENIIQKKEAKSGGFIRALSCLPCLPAYEEMPETPNINKLKEIFGKFKDSKTSEIDVNLVERSRSTDLAEWTQKVVTFLPSVNGAPESAKETNQITNHFKTIKKFYTAVNNAGFESSELEVLFNALQIYESVMPLAFVMFHEHPRVMNSITSSIDQALVKIEDQQNMGCCILILCGGALLTKFYSILSVIDKKIGEFNITSVCEFISDIMEVFCRYFDIDLTDTDKLAALADAIQELAKAASGKLKVMFGDLLPEVKREKKWGALSITKNIRSKLAQFDTGSAIVERTMNSFENFFKAVEGIDDRYERTRGHVARTAPVNGEDEFTEENENENIRHFESSGKIEDVSVRITSNQDSAIEEVKEVAKVFQYIETILSYGVLVFKNEEEILNPLLDHVDEATRILVKFSELHPLYQIILGTNYLSKLKVVLRKILDLLKQSKLQINSPREFLNEVKMQYPNLIYILCKDMLDEKLKKRLEFLPDNLKGDVSGAIDGALDKFKNKFKL